MRADVNSRLQILIHDLSTEHSADNDPHWINSVFLSHIGTYEKFVHLVIQMLLADLVVSTFMSSFCQGQERFNPVDLGLFADIFPHRMLDDFMFVSLKFLVTGYSYFGSGAEQLKLPIRGLLPMPVTDPARNAGNGYTAAFQESGTPSTPESASEGIRLQLR